MVDRDRCPGCGHHLSKTRRVPGRPDPVHKVDIIVCTNCRDVADMQRVHHAADEDRRKDNAPVNDAGRIYTSVEMPPPTPEKR